MEHIYVKKIRDIERLHSELEERLHITLRISGHFVTLAGSPLDEYDAIRVFDAIHFGFSVKKALSLKDEGAVFRTVHIKDHTRRNLRAVLSRLIGTTGKTRRTISEISGCALLITDCDVGIIGDAELVKNVETAIIHLIRGSKQSNMYKYLEKANRAKKTKVFDVMIKAR